MTEDTSLCVLRGNREKAGSHWELKPGHLPCVASALTILLYVLLKCLGLTSGSHSAIKTLLGADWKILSIRCEPMLSGFLSLNV